MASYVKQRLAEIQADPALRRRPKRLTFRRQVAVAVRLLSVLGHDKRLLTVVHLMDRERTVTDLLSRVGGSQHSLSQHLSLLVEHGILECRDEGIWRYYSCKSEEARAVIRLLNDLARNSMIPKSSTGALQRP